MTLPAPKAGPQPVVDLREELLRSIRGARVTAAVTAAEPGVVAGMRAAAHEAEQLGLAVLHAVHDGTEVGAGDELARLVGTPGQIVRAEDVLLGALGKPSGIATRTRAFVDRARGGPKVVSGGWKKMPAALKEMIRSAVAAGGGHSRILPGPFVYLDKNYVELLGGIREGLAAVEHLGDVAKVVQVKGRYADVATEACEAAERGAAVVFVDTGRREDVSRATAALVRRGLRGRVQVAFGGGVTLDDVDALRALDLDILDVGRQIVDAPLLDLRLDVVETRRGE